MTTKTLTPEQKKALVMAIIDEQLTEPNDKLKQAAKRLFKINKKQNQTPTQ